MQKRIGIAAAIVFVIASFAGIRVAAMGEPEDDTAGILPTIILPCSFFEDIFEDNDTIGAAWPVMSPSSLSALSCLGDDDYYSFSVAAGTTLQIDATFTHANGDIDIFLFNGADTQVAHSNGTVDNESITYLAATSGIYKVDAHMFSDPPDNGNTYDLSIDASCPPAGHVGPTYTDALTSAQPIPDEPSPGMSNCITIPDSATISDLSVGLDLTHTWVGDLTVTLTHEDSGHQVTLIDRPGHPAIGLGCNGNNISVVLDDAAASPVEGKCNGATPTISGTLRPQEALSNFAGDNISGVWRITINDAATPDIGNLVAWSLTPEFAPDATPTSTRTRTPTPTSTVPGAPTATATMPGAPTATSTLEKAFGDVNDDGSVNSIDAALVLQYGGGLLGALPNGASADVNESGGIDSIDAALILQFSAGLLSHLPP